ncbi:MAG: hypothetical protein KAI33_06045, partial [Elusimicrobiales bacterium]|nr:hypothetical protein [Elusimicrobiales bacterium]
MAINESHKLTKGPIAGNFMPLENKYMLKNMSKTVERITGINMASVEYFLKKNGRKIKTTDNDVKNHMFT